MASLPIRLRSSGGHSHRPTTKVDPKAFKSRKSTKGRLRNLAKGRIEPAQTKARHRQLMSKVDRRNQSKLRQLAKRKEHLKENSIFTGRNSAPRIVAVLPLCHDGDSRRAIRELNASLDIELQASEDVILTIPADRFRQQLQYIPLQRDLTSCLDAARVADFLLVILSAASEVDELGDLILRSLIGQGVSSVYTVVQGAEHIDAPKQRQQVIFSLKSYISHFLPDQEKLFSLDNRQECSNLLRTICVTTPRGIQWRDSRSWMLVEDVQSTATIPTSTVLTGIVRGHGLKADRLVQLGDAGTFKILKIVAASPARSPKISDLMAVDEVELEEHVLDEPGEDQDDLADLAPEEMAVDMHVDSPFTDVVAPKKGVLLDEHHYFPDEEHDAARTLPKRLPRGTSGYQASWYLDEDNASESGTDLEGDADMVDVAVEKPLVPPEDGTEGQLWTENRDGPPSEYPRSEIYVEPTADEDKLQLVAHRASRQHEAADDQEFPDEIELHPSVLARERLARFRGLKSLRTSPWLREEDAAHEPNEWQRLLRVPDFRTSRLRYTKEALTGGVAPGTRVHVYLKDVPAEVHTSICHNVRKQPLTMVSLLRHEHKQTVVNYLISLSSDYPTSIKSKEEMVIQCGPRRFRAKPIFSQPGTSPNDVHKYCRFLHPGQSAVATFIGPVSWGSLPTLFFQKTGGNLKLAANGTAIAPSTSRVIIKRAILTGHPYHVHKKIVTVRYMFFNREDVDWFKALPLWTKRGRVGNIKEAIGTHGYFKATFDGRINPQDAIGVSLYKRVWPRPSAPFQGRLLDSVGEDNDVEMMHGAIGTTSAV